MRMKFMPINAIDLQEQRPLIAVTYIIEWLKAELEDYQIRSEEYERL